ncbi:hypothetical protein [Halopseudomonas salegens]|uniref:Uncharacterized protein n=1 Tax=Halopseudomonas salegens TaxID=1434072 RepID=A0A1H2FGL6_9GAMM|nr:hypothetical protein [Halopseudomonas salegens]SDU06413.1 hypothetical protein SAMN05216210_1539 [Halopseudomonas salegens]
MPCFILLIAVLVWSSVGYTALVNGQFSIAEAVFYLFIGAALVYATGKQKSLHPNMFVFVLNILLGVLLVLAALAFIAFYLLMKILVMGMQH